MIYAERLKNHLGKEKGEGKDMMMQDNTEELGLMREDNVSSISDAEERRVLEEELGWARLERQKILALSADADDAIWYLASLARRRMQERDEARNQARMLLEDLQLQARNGRMMALPGTSGSRVARPHAFSAAGYKHSQALAPEFRPLDGTMMQGQRARAGTGYCAASSSGFGGHRNIGSSLDAYAVQPSLPGFASSSHDHFDPDMFLVDVVESPQDVVPVPAAAGLFPIYSSEGAGTVLEEPQTVVSSSAPSFFTEKELQTTSVPKSFGTAQLKEPKLEPMSPTKWDRI